jgi:NadR type nicotinamide-nucleotide adenylyltransferase
MADCFKIGIIGPESSGKSSLARYLAKRYEGTYVPEYAREYIERKGTRDVSFDELCEIARYQIQQLDSIVNQSSNRQSSNRQYFFDTELIVTKVWFDYAFGRVPEWLDEAIRQYPMDVYLLTAPDIAWQPDPARYHGSQAMRQELFDRYEEEIQALDIPYYIITHV